LKYFGNKIRPNNRETNDSDRVRQKKAHLSDIQDSKWISSFYGRGVHMFTVNVSLQMNI